MRDILMDGGMQQLRGRHKTLLDGRQRNQQGAQYEAAAAR